MATPLRIIIGLWYHCRAGDYGKGVGSDEDFDAPAVQAVLQDMVDAGLLGKSPKNSEAEYFATEALTVWVNGLCNVPWPVKQVKWVLGNG